MDSPATSPSPRSSRRVLLAGTLIALSVALLATWLFVLRPANDSSSLSAQQLVNADARQNTDDDAAEVGLPAPSAKLTRYAGGTIDLASLRGKPVVINFWSSSCTPCIKEMPLLERVHKKLGDSVAFVGVDAFETPAAGKAMVERTGVTYLQTVDPTDAVLAKFGGTQLPHTVVLAADGTVAALHNTSITDDKVLLDLIKAAG